MKDVILRLIQYAEDNPMVVVLAMILVTAIAIQALQ